MRIPKYAKYDYTIGANSYLTITQPGKYLAVEYVVPSIAFKDIYISIDDGQPIPLSYLPIATSFEQFTIFNQSAFQVNIRVIIAQEDFLRGGPLWNILSAMEPVSTEVPVSLTTTYQQLGSEWSYTYFGKADLGTFYLGGRKLKTTLKSISLNPKTLKMLKLQVLTDTREIVWSSAVYVSWSGSIGPYTYVYPLGIVSREAYGYVALSVWAFSDRQTSINATFRIEGL